MGFPEKLSYSGHYARYFIIYNSQNNPLISFLLCPIHIKFGFRLVSALDPTVSMLQSRDLNFKHLLQTYEPCNVLSTFIYMAKGGGCLYFCFPIDKDQKPNVKTISLPLRCLHVMWSGQRKWQQDLFSTPFVDCFKDRADIQLVSIPIVKILKSFCASWLKAASLSP